MFEAAHLIDLLLDISAFAVGPAYQGQGIVSQLLKHCLDITDLTPLSTWLIAFPGSHSLYLRFGFKDVEHRDVDLNAWDNGILRGYGIYRQYAMVRDIFYKQKKGQVDAQTGMNPRA